MPYITEERRVALSEGQAAENWGEISYIITNLMLNIYNASDKNYDFFSSAIGCLETVKLELYRRMVSPYEDVKALENGDIFVREEEEQVDE